MRRERASVRASFLEPGARLAAGLAADLDTGLDADLDAGRDTDLAADFADGFPLAACPLCRLRAAAGLALRAPLAPLAPLA